MKRSIPLAILASIPLLLSSCGPTTGTYSSTVYTPVYSVYQPPLVIHYDDYHSHGDHHHHHSHEDGEQRQHYHPDNRWDKIAYDTANKSLTTQDISNLNQLTAPTTKKKKK